MKKSKTCQFGSAKWFWPSICAQFGKAGKRDNKSLTLTREEYNKCDMIGASCF